MYKMIYLSQKKRIAWLNDLPAQALLMLLLFNLIIGNCGSQVFKVPLKRSPGLLRQAVVEKRESVAPDYQDNLQGKPGEGYYIDMGIGTPPQVMQVLVDTGSSNFAVAAADHQFIPYYYNHSQSSTYSSLEQSVRVPYTQGEWDGFLGTDVITIPSFPGLNATANIAGITQSEMFFINGSHWQGILGLAYEAVARPDPSLTPFFDSLVEQNDIEDIFSMQLCGTLDKVDVNDASMGGTMVIGGIDNSLYTGEMLYAMMYREWYYEVIITAIAVGEDSIDMDCKEYNFDKTIVDSGTTNLRLPDRVFEEVTRLISLKTLIANKHLPPAFLDGTDILCWDHGKTPWHAFPSLTLTLAIALNTTMELGIGPQQYLRTVPDTNTSSNEDCIKYAIAPSRTGAVLGAVVMEAFYVVFDRANKQVGFAETTCDSLRSTNHSVFVKGPFNTTVDVVDCAYHKPTQKREPLMVAAYIMGAVCVLALIPLVAFFINWQWQSCRRRKEEPLHDVTDLLSQNTDENAVERGEEERQPQSD